MARFPLIALVSCLATAAAYAQSPAPAPSQPTAPAPVAVQTAADIAPDANVVDTETDTKRLSDRHCLRETGSRITKRDGKPRCTGHAGRVYTKDDIDRTGHTDLSDALRTLDPSIR